MPPLVPLHQRAASKATTVERRLKLVEMRLDGSLPAQAGVIDPGYTSGDPMVTVGDDDATSGPYQHLASYSPAAGDPVALIRLAGTWLVIGKLA